ncbi:MAG: orotate phosphoribosyltransferase [Nanoarchaeota archaeon]
MENYQEGFVKFLADSGILFFREGLVLKDGRPTPYFFNAGNVLDSSKNLATLSDSYASMIKGVMAKGLEVDTLFGPAYKGIALAVGAAQSLWRNDGINLGVVYDRKEEKTHGEGSTSANLFVGNFPPDARTYLIDDVLTSARTKLDALSKIESLGRSDISVFRVGIAFDREQVNLEGRNAVYDFTQKTGIPVDSIVGARDAMRFLFELRHPLTINGVKQSMPQNVYNDFQRYMDKYGARE